MTDNRDTIWKEFKSGSNSAFERIYYQHIDVLYRYGSKITADKHLLKDSIQQLFLELYSSRERLADPENIEFYLLKALKRIIIHKMNSNRRSGDLFDSNFPFFDIDADTENMIISNEHEHAKMKLLEDVLRSLEPAKKELLFLKFYSGLSNQQIGLLTGLQPDTVQKQLYRILKKLQVTFIDRFLQLFTICFKA
ncbi:MAG: sigma-70 family RNA polymerase sigma factor [Prolixibacteraceae bacterium]